MHKERKVYGISECAGFDFKIVQKTNNDHMLKTQGFHDENFRAMLKMTQL